MGASAQQRDHARSLVVDIVAVRALAIGKRYVRGSGVRLLVFCVEGAWPRAHAYMLVHVVWCSLSLVRFCSVGRLVDRLLECWT